MEKNIEIKMVEQTVITYISKDGRVFKNEADCKAWEEGFQCTLAESFLKMNMIEVSPCTLGIPYETEEHTIYIVIPKDEAEVNTINLINKTHSWGDNKTLTTQDVGKKIIMEFGYGFEETEIFNSDFIAMYRFDDLKKQILKTYEDIENEFKKKEQE